MVTSPTNALPGMSLRIIPPKSQTPRRKRKVGQQFEVQIHRSALTTTPPPSSVSPPQGGQGFGSTNCGVLTTTPPPLSFNPSQGGQGFGSTNRGVLTTTPPPSSLSPPYGCGLTNQVATPPTMATYEGHAPQTTVASGESRLSPSWKPHLFEDFYLTFD